MATITTRPVIAEALVFTASDTIAAVGSATDAGGDVDLDNIIDPNQSAVTHRVGRTATSAVSGDGWRVTLNTETTVSAVALLNMSDSGGLPSGARFEVRGRDGSATPVFLTDNGSGHYVRPSDVWTSHATRTTNNPVRPVWLPGVDNLNTPTQGSPATIATWSCKDIAVTWKTSGTSYLEVAGLALGINAVSLANEIPNEQLKITNLALRQGYGYRYEVTFPTLGEEDLQALTYLWQKSEGGQAPVFFCPAPGAVAAADGTISGTENTPALRGGLMRFESLQHTERGEAASGYLKSTTAVFHTWQEVKVG